MIELELETVENWLTKGTIWLIEIGNENSYYEDEFGTRYFCKDYPDPTPDCHACYQENCNCNFD